MHGEGHRFSPEVDDLNNGRGGYSSPMINRKVGHAFATAMHTCTTTIWIAACLCS